MISEKEFLDNISFIIDTREQTPYVFTGRKSIVHGLPVGDYGLGRRNKAGNVELLSVAIERKTLDDFLGSISKGRERFEREVHKGKALDYFAIIIEASFAEIESGEFRSLMPSKSVIGTIYSWSVKHRTPIWFCDSRKKGESTVVALLEFYALNIYKKYKILEQQNPHKKE